MTDPKEGVIECETAQNPGNFNFYFQLFAAFAFFFPNLMILPENFDLKSKNRGSLGVTL